MKVLALDIETTGLDPSEHQILEVGAIYAEVTATGIEELGVFRKILDHREIHGTPKALAMNAKLLDEIDECRQSRDKRLVKPYELFSHLLFWCYEVDRKFNKQQVTLIGKDLRSFDLNFLEGLQGWDPDYFHRRIIDVGSLWVQETDTEVPNLKECLRRSGCDKEIAPTALEDCRDSLRCLSAHFAR